MPRKQWFATDVNVFNGDFGVDLREQFGPVGMVMWIGFLAACKRSATPGKITYSSDAEALSLLSIPGMELIDEEGEPFKLDDFWTFTGQHKQTRCTRRKRLVYVTSTRWGEWQKDVKRQTEAERKARSRADSGRTEPGQDSDYGRTEA